MLCAVCGHENSATARFCEACGGSLAGGSEERRKVVTVLFCDVVGSTALGESTDPEALRGLLARYFEVMRGIVESHEGTVEKFIGDAVMVVFGVPVVHEDDALRACRAAVEMRDAFVGLGIEGRIGVCTGEVVTGTVERLVTGDALNVAARLQSAAAPGAVLIAGDTRLQAGAAVEVEAVEPLVLKGKSEPVAAFRLVAAHAAAERPHDSVFVGRSRELGLLAGAWLLAGRRGDQAARRLAVRSGGRARDPFAPRRVRRGSLGGGDRVGVPDLARGGCGLGGRRTRAPTGRCHRRWTMSSLSSMRPAVTCLPEPSP